MEEQKKHSYFVSLLYKFYKVLKDRFDPPRKITEEEKYSYQICLKLIQDNQSKLTLAPISNKRYITSEKNSMFVVIWNNTVVVINHVYSYTVYFENNEDYHFLLKSFDEELEKRRAKLEEEINRNIQHSLKRILDSIH